MSVLIARVLRTIERHRMLDGGSRVLVAFSGGPDSVALLHLMRTLHADGRLSLAGAAHFNHRLRPAADEDEAFCASEAARLDVPFTSGSGDVATEAARAKRSLEDTARRLRYAFLHEAADRLGADHIAVGHSRDDQAETVLLRLLRGAGPRGLSGIRPRAGRVIRPLLDVSRTELRQYVRDAGLPFQDDESNADLTIPRNRIRHELIPILRAYSPRIERVLAKAAAIAATDEDRLEAEAIDLARSVVLTGIDGVELDAERLRSAHPAIASRVVRLALEQASPGRFVGADELERVLALIQGQGRAVTLAGHHLVRRGARVVMGPPPEPPFSNLSRVPLSIPGEVTLAGWAVTASDPGHAGALPPSVRGDDAVVAAAPLRLPLAVRTRRPGDRFRPFGMGGRGRKLQDFLVDRKVASAVRDRVPLVVDCDDRIVWVVGHGIAEEFRVTGPSEGVILLKARRLGGVG